MTAASAPIEEPRYVFGLLSVEQWRFAKYAAIGVLNGVVDIAILGVLVLIFNPQRDLTVAATNTASFTLASINSYLLHSRFTFQRKLPIFSRWFALFLLANLGNLILSNIALLTFRWVNESYIGVEGRAAILLAKVMTAGVLVGYGYIAFSRVFMAKDSPAGKIEIPMPRLPEREPRRMPG